MKPSSPLHTVPTAYESDLAWLRPLISCATMTELSRSNVLSAYQRLRNRIALLEEIGTAFRDRMREYNEAGICLSSHEFDLQCYSALREIHPAPNHNPRRFLKFLSSRRINYILGKAVTDRPSLFDASIPLETFSQTLTTHACELDLVLSLFSRLDIKNTIDQAYCDDPELPLILKLTNEYFAERPAKDVRDCYFHEARKGRRDEAYEVLVRMTYSSRKSVMQQRVLREMTCRHEEGWYMVFDTLTFSEDGLELFYETPTALRDYFRSIGRLVIEAEQNVVDGKTGPYYVKGRNQASNFDDCYRYFCVPEYGTKHGRLHFHAVHMFRTLPLGDYDRNQELPPARRNWRELQSFKNEWATYGNSQPRTVRYANDAYTRDGWLWPLNQEKTGPLLIKPLLAVARYMCKYVSKMCDQQLTSKDIPRWNSSLTPIIRSIPKASFRVRMSRNLGMQFPSLSTLSEDNLLALANLDYSLTPYSSLLKRSVKKELRMRLASLPLAALLDAAPPAFNLLAALRALIAQTGSSNQQSFTVTTIPKLLVGDISDELYYWLWLSGCLHPKPLESAESRSAPK